MQEIPMPYVKANQVGIVLFVVVSIALQTPWLLAVLWAIQVAGLLTRGRFNLFVRIAKPFLRTEGKETQAEVLQRFNNTLAVIFLTLSLISFALGWTAAGTVFAVLLLAAAGVALLGYCIGCTMYYQYKRITHKLRHG
jgi:cobalamin synthase